MALEEGDLSGSVRQETPPAALRVSAETCYCWHLILPRSYLLEGPQKTFSGLCLSCLPFILRASKLRGGALGGVEWFLSLLVRHGYHQPVNTLKGEHFLFVLKMTQ